MLRPCKALVLLVVLLSGANSLWAASGTEGASFLDIPVGGRPAAMGSAYSALATDSYAPIYNPGAMSFSPVNELSAMHLAYVDSVNYEFASFVHPLTASDAMGLSAQVLLPGSINGTDINGNSIGSISGHYGAYGLSYAHTFDERLGVGLNAKVVNAAISDASANAFAADIGTLYKMDEHLSLSAVATNLGSQLKFVDQADNLPGAFHGGAAYVWNSHWTGSSELVYERQGLFSARFGGEWTPVEALSVRLGYRTDTAKNLSALAGLTTGLGLHLWGQELDYAWLPLGDLGNTQYISLVIRFGEQTAVGRVLKTMSHPNSGDDDREDLNKFMEETTQDSGYKDINK